MPEVIQFKTLDDVTIVGDWVTTLTTRGVVLLLHMMPSDRKSWALFQQDLAKVGLASLAIDLRGHGESLKGPEGGALDFRNFSDSEHQTSLYDVIAAVEWIRRRGIDLSTIGLCGASIGANLALQMLLEERSMPSAVLLSPGKNYRGTNAIADSESLAPDQQLLIVASEGDDQESFEASKATYEHATAEKKLFIPLKHAGHGTNMFTAQPQLSVQVIEWLKNVVQGV